jgi:hypothetical protein
MFIRNSSARALSPLKVEGKFLRIFPSDPAAWVTGNASWKSLSSSSWSPPFGCSGSSSGGPPRFIALSMRALRLLLWVCFPLPDPSPWVSVCTSTLVLVPILISVGMGASWCFSGSYMESGEVGRSSGISTVSLAGVSLAICSSMLGRLAPRYGFDWLSPRSVYHLSPR